MKQALLSLLIFIVSSFAALAGDPILIGHRGLLGEAPENTLPAFEACLAAGFGFELDIRMSKDGELVILHDDELDIRRSRDGEWLIFHDDRLGRATGGPTRRLSEFTLEEMKRFDAGRWYAQKFAGTRIPTLEEVLASVKRQKKGPTIVMLDTFAPLTREGEKRLVELVRQYDLLEQSFAFNQSDACSRRLKAIDPRFRIGQKIKWKEFQSQRNANAGPVDVFLPVFVPTAAEVTLLHSRGKLAVFCEAAHNLQCYRNSSIWELVRRAGVDGVLTDYPRECQAHWQRSKGCDLDDE